MSKKNLCVLCGSDKFTQLYKIDEYTLEKCDSCNLVRTKDFTSPSYSKYHRDEQYEESEMFFRYIFRKRFNIIAKFKKEPGVVLDVGAATGVMLDIFVEHGWETCGVEPSGSYKRALEKGHKVYHTTLEQFATTDRFDVVIANHVLEHIERPQDFLRLCKKYLKKDGILYIDVPNFGSLRSKVSGKHWKYILPSEHVFHFTKKTLTDLLEMNGFEVIYSTSRSGLFETSNPVAYLFLELVNGKKNFFNDILSLPFNLVATVFDQGDSMGIVCKAKK